MESSRTEINKIGNHPRLPIPQDKQKKLYPRLEVEFRIPFSLAPRKLWTSMYVNFKYEMLSKNTAHIFLR